jgi:hypothetical protein
MSATVRGGSRFRIRPNPAVAGQPLEVTYIGPAKEVEYQVDDGEPVKVEPDKNGKFTIDPVPSGDEIVLWDGLGLPGYLHAEIVNLVGR